MFIPSASAWHNGDGTAHYTFVYEAEIKKIAAGRGGLRNGQLFFPTVSNAKSETMFGWLDWITGCNLPLSVVTNKYFRSYSNLKGIDVGHEES
jgi:hypothetical protein